MTTTGIIAYGSYIPRSRLQRNAIGLALGLGSEGGTRSVASHDEDTTTLAVAAARNAIDTSKRAYRFQQLYFCTAAPAYLDRTNATAIHAALGLAPSVQAADFMGSARSGLAALDAGVVMAGAGQVSLILLSDTRSGMPGSADETRGGDAAAALIVGPDGCPAPVIAEHLASAHMTGEFLDRWRAPAESSSQSWEERFGAQQYEHLALDAFHDALLEAAISPAEIDHLVVCGDQRRAVKSVAARCGVRREAIWDDRSRSIGNPGTAQLGVSLADVLDHASPGQLVATLTLADGATASVWRTTPALNDYRKTANPTVAEQIACGDDTLTYADFLTWTGQLTREPPRRPDPAIAYPPSSARSTDWKFGFLASRCLKCEMRHLPPARLCWNCHGTDEMATERMSNCQGTIATFSVDRLAYTLSPPLVVAVVDFDGGGRFTCELTDVDANSVAVGDRVDMTFRRISSNGGIHNYFWKARPSRARITQEA